MLELRAIRVVHYGLGAIGSSIARLTSAQRGLEVVGGIDCDPAKVRNTSSSYIRMAVPAISSSRVDCSQNLSVFICYYGGSNDEQRA